MASAVVTAVIADGHGHMLTQQELDLSQLTVDVRQAVKSNSLSND